MTLGGSKSFLILNIFTTGYALPGIRPISFNKSWPDSVSPALAKIIHFFLFAESSFIYKFLRELSNVVIGAHVKSWRIKSIFLNSIFE